MGSQGKPVHVPNYAKFIIGGLSGMTGTLIVQPLDLIKNRMQLSGEGGAERDYTSSIDATRKILKREGIRGLYSGMSANLFRQATYTTLRMGMYQMTLEYLYSIGYSGLTPQVTSGLLAGFAGSFIATPSDVAFVRMTADGKLPPSERRNYKNIFDALKRLAIEEGRKGMFAGLSPTILRAMFANVTQLVSYTQAKDFLINNGYMEDDINCHLTSSVVSGMVYSVSTIPLDVAKTRIQQMKSSEAGIPMYSGLVDVFVKTVKNEGVLALWKGFGPFYVRVAPFTIILFVVNEQLLAMYKQYVIGI